MRRRERRCHCMSASHGPDCPMLDFEPGEEDEPPLVYRSSDPIYQVRRDPPPGFKVELADDPETDIPF